MPKSIFSIVVFLTAGFVAASTPLNFTITPDVQAALGHIRADSLRGDLSFLASDLLEGRDTPSRGLDIAAEYIAAQFRRAGLEPGGDDGYFQTAHMEVVRPDARRFVLRLSNGKAMFSAEPTETTFRTSDALDLTGAPVFKLVASDAGLIERLTAADVTGKVVIVELDLKRTASLRAANAKLRQWKPALRILVDAKGVMESGAAQRLVDPEQAETSGPQVVLKGRAAAEFYGSLKPGLSGAVATVHIEAPERKLVTLHNVVGVLRGADPALRDTCVLLTAHYDHIGMRPDGQGDRIYNGANDDGSGTVSVLEVARALAAMNPRPRRSIVFVTFFGEEEGLVGSRYYARHPAWPLAKTAAQLNLEQVGRTDSSEGKQISNASLTGFDFSSLTRFVQRAGELTGIKIYKNGQDSDAYFTQSDNLPIAEVGVPAETLTVAFDFPDYHRPGDEWQKIDYGNMAKVDRAIALSLVIMADSDEAPAWNADNPKTAPYVKAWRERHP